MQWQAIIDATMRGSRELPPERFAEYRDMNPKHLERLRSPYRPEAGSMTCAPFLEGPDSLVGT